MVGFVAVHNDVSIKVPLIIPPDCTAYEPYTITIEPNANQLIGEVITVDNNTLELAKIT